MLRKSQRGFKTMTWHGKKVLQGVNPWLRLPCLRNVKLNITTKLGAQIIYTYLRSTLGKGQIKKMTLYKMSDGSRQSVFCHLSVNNFDHFETGLQLQRGRVQGRPQAESLRKLFVAVSGRSRAGSGLAVGDRLQRL